MLPASDPSHSIRRNREASNENIDALAACLLAIQMLNGAPTRNRSIVFQLVYRQIPAKLLKGRSILITTNLKQE